MTINKITYGLIVVLLTVVGYLAMAGLANNTEAMDRLAVSLERIEYRLGTHEVELKEHEVVIKFNSKRLDKAGL